MNIYMIVIFSSYLIVGTERYSIFPSKLLTAAHSPQQLLQLHHEPLPDLVPYAVRLHRQNFQAGQLPWLEVGLLLSHS